jgi:hypothetical protein
MPQANGGGRLQKKKGKKFNRIEKKREGDKNFIIGTIKAIDGGKYATVVLKETGETMRCRMPKGIRTKYRLKDEVKINEFEELIGKLVQDKEDIDYEFNLSDEEQTVEMGDYNKEIRKTINKERAIEKNSRARVQRQENDISSDESSTESEEESTDDDSD